MRLAKAGWGYSPSYAFASRSGTHRSSLGCLRALRLPPPSADNMPRLLWDGRIIHCESGTVKLLK